MLFHIAAVDDVAVNTCPFVGATAELTFIVVVVDFNEFALILLLSSVIVLYVSVWVSVVPTTEPVTPWTVEEFDLCVSICVCVFDPLPVKTSWFIELVESSVLFFNVCAFSVPTKVIDESGIAKFLFVL